MTEQNTLLRGGRNAAQRAEADRADREKRRASSFNLWEYLRLAAPDKGEVYGESKIVRLVTDEPEWLEVKQHSFVNTKPAPADKPADKKWPAQMGAVCRYTETANGTWFDDCVICDQELAKGEGKNGPYVKKPGTRLWAVAVEREEYTDDEGETSYRDVMTEYRDKDGNVTSIPKFLVLNFAMDNFFDSLLGFNQVYKTVRDRDYQITRQGSGTDTNYVIVALDPITEVRDGKIVKVIPEYELPFSLYDIVAEQASEDHYNWFFNPDVKSSWVARYGAPKEKSDEQASASSGTEESADADADRQARLLAMKQELEATRKAKANA